MKKYGLILGLAIVLLFALTSITDKLGSALTSATGVNFGKSFWAKDPPPPPPDKVSYSPSPDNWNEITPIHKEETVVDKQSTVERDLKKATESVKGDIGYVSEKDILCYKNKCNLYRFTFLRKKSIDVDGAAILVKRKNNTFILLQDVDFAKANFTILGRPFSGYGLEREADYLPVTFKN